MKYLPIVLALPFFLGMGAVFRAGMERAVKIRLPLSPGLLLPLGAYFAGYLTITANILIPTDPYFSSVLFLLGLGVFVWKFRDFRKEKGEIGWILLLFPILALFGIRRSFSSDSSSYHLPGMAWTKTEPLPLGIANLNDALGFNSIMYGTNAAAQPPFLDLASAFLVNAWISAAALALFFRWFNASRGPGVKSRIYPALVTLSLLPISTYFGSNLGSPTMELSTTWLAVLTFFCGIVSVEDKESRLSWIFLSVFLAYVSTLIRLSSLQLLAVGPALYLFFLRRKEIRLDRGFLLRTTAVLGLIALPWLIRGILSTGCLAYPAHFTCIKALPWNSYEMAKNVAHGSAVWVRAPGTSYESLFQDWSWLGIWWPNFWAFGIVKITILFLAVSIPLLVWNRARVSWGALGLFSLLLLVTILFWFLNYPEVRYAYGLFLAAGPLILTFAAAPLWQDWMGKFLKPLPVVVVLVFAFKAWGLVKSPIAPDSYVAWPEMPALNYQPFVPYPGDETIFTSGSIHDNCWLKLPCQRRATPGIRAEKKGGRYVFRMEPGISGPP